MIFRKTVFDGILFAFLLSVASVVIFVTSEEQLLNLPSIALIVLSYFGLGCGVSVLLKKTRIVTLGDVLFKTSAPTLADKPWYLRF